MAPVSARSLKRTRRRPEERLRGCLRTGGSETTSKSARASGALRRGLRDAARPLVLHTGAQRRLNEVQLCAVDLLAPLVGGRTRRLGRGHGLLLLGSHQDVRRPAARTVAPLGTRSAACLVLLKSRTRLPRARGRYARSDECVRNRASRQAPRAGPRSP